MTAETGAVTTAEEGTTAAADAHATRPADRGSDQAEGGAALTVPPAGLADRPAAAAGLRRPPVAAVAAVAVTVAVALVALVLLVINQPDSVADRAPSTTAAPVTTVSPGSAPATTTPPAGPRPTRAPLADVAAGDLCGWQDVGSVETAVDGRRVRCDYDGREYHWVPQP